MHSGSFGCLTKLDAKRAAVVQKFVPRNRVGIFQNECIRSTPLHRKLTFWRVSYYLGAFGTVWLPYETRCKTAELVQKFVPRSRVGIFHNKHTRSTPLYPKLTFCTIWVHFGPFGGLIKLGAKRAELVQKFVPRSHVFTFHNKRTRSTPLDPKLTFCTIWVHSVPFGCLTKLGAKRVELVQKFVKRSRIGIFRNECSQYTRIGS